MGLPFSAWPKDGPAPETTIEPPTTPLWRPYATDYSHLTTPFPTVSILPAMTSMSMSPLAGYRPMPIPSLGQSYAMPFATPSPAPMMMPLPFAPAGAADVSPYHALAPIARAARESDVSLSYVRDMVENATNGDWSTRPDYTTYAVLKGWAEDGRTQIEAQAAPAAQSQGELILLAETESGAALVLCQLLPRPSLAGLTAELAPLAAESLTDSPYPLITSIARDLHPVAVAAKAEADEKKAAAENKYRWDVWTGMMGRPGGGHAWRPRPGAGDVAWGQYLVPHSVGAVGYIPADMWWTRWPRND